MLNITKLKLLHAIRGFAAFYVVIYHAKFILWSGGSEYAEAYPRADWNPLTYVLLGLDMLSSAGMQMVIIFFVLSGFFIAYSFAKNKQSFKDFYINRAIRIYAPYIGSMIIGAGILYLIGAFDPALYHVTNNREINTRLIFAYNNLTFSNLLKSFAFLKDKEYIGCNYAYWSLLYEGMFYLIVPLVVLRPKIYVYASAILFGIGIAIHRDNFNNGGLSNFIFNFNIHFAIGVFIYNNIEAMKERVIGIKRAKLYLIGISLAALIIMIGLRALGRSQTAANLLADVICGSLIVLFISFDFSHNLFLAAVKKLGEVSFSLYLIHIPVMLLLYACIHKLTGTVVIYDHIYPIGVICAVLFSFPFYKWVEEPSVKLIRLIKERNKQTA
jgi:peptidoglycan/LPS O-acetylase OafA/YrhL